MVDCETHGNEVTKLITILFSGHVKLVEGNIINAFLTFLTFNPCAPLYLRWRFGSIADKGGSRGICLPPFPKNILWFVYGIICNYL